MELSFFLGKKKVPSWRNFSSWKDKWTDLVYP